jgi:phosphopantetheinyl transferase
MTNLYVVDIYKCDRAEMLELARQRGHFEVIEKFHAIGNATAALHYLSGELLMRKVCKQETGLSYQEQVFLNNEHGKPMLKNNSGWHSGNIFRTCGSGCGENPGCTNECGFQVLLNRGDSDA